VKRKGGTARDRLKEAWSEIAVRRTGTGYEAALGGRAGRKSRSPYPSRALVVNPAGVRRRLRDLPQETCAVSHGTGAIARWPDRGAGVSRGHSRPKPSVRSSGTLARKGRNGQGSHDRERAAEGPNDWEGESGSQLMGDMRPKIQ
jgi:hypothetical protein